MRIQILKILKKEEPKKEIRLSLSLTKWIFFIHLKQKWIFWGFPILNQLQPPK